MEKPPPLTEADYTRNRLAYEALSATKAGIPLDLWMDLTPDAQAGLIEYARQRKAIARSDKARSEKYYRKLEAEEARIRAIADPGARAAAEKWFAYTKTERYGIDRKAEKEARAEARKLAKSQPKEKAKRAATGVALSSYERTKRRRQRLRDARRVMDAERADSIHQPPA